MGYLQIAEMGLENFSRYGKLIGTGKKNGVQVFERLLGYDRILTSIEKNGNILKTVRTTYTSNQYLPNSFADTIAKTGNTGVITTTAHNFQSGEEILHIYTTDHSYDRFLRSKGQEWESFTAYSPNKKEKVCAYSDINGRIDCLSYDLKNHRGLAVTRTPFGTGNNLKCDSFQIKNGKKSTLELAGCQIPNHIEACSRQGQIVNVSGGERNLVKQVLGSFDKMFAKLVGYKPKS